MEAERKRQFVLAGLAIVLAVVVYRAWPTTSPARPPASNQQRASGTSGASPERNRKNAPAGQNGPAGPATDVHLEALEAERPKPGSADRDLFRFREKRQTHQGNRGDTPSPVVPTPPTEPSVPPPPPGPPPIGLKFIGVVDQGAGRPKIAVLSDGTGPPLYGKEGELVAGRYRILKIGEESIELAYADGRGRQTVRLTGS